MGLNARFPWKNNPPIFTLWLQFAVGGGAQQLKGPGSGRQSFSNARLQRTDRRQAVRPGAGDAPKGHPHQRSYWPLEALVAERGNLSVRAECDATPLAERCSSTTASPWPKRAVEITYPPNPKLNSVIARLIDRRMAEELTRLMDGPRHGPLMACGCT